MWFAVLFSSALSCAVLCCVSLGAALRRAAARCAARLCAVVRCVVLLRSLGAVACCAVPSGAVFMEAMVSWLINGENIPYVWNPRCLLHFTVL